MGHDGALAVDDLSVVMVLIEHVHVHGHVVGILDRAGHAGLHAHRLLRTSTGSLNAREEGRRFQEGMPGMLDNIRLTRNLVWETLWGNRRSRRGAAG